MTTMSKVAAHAGVGIGTVSRVLNGSDHVTPETRARVMAAVAAVGYVRNVRGSKASEQGTFVGVVIPDFGSPSSSQRLVGLVAALKAGGVNVVVYAVSTPDEARRTLMELPRSRDVGGVVVMSLPLQGDEGERLAGARFPVVLLDTSHPALPRVTIDGVEGGRIATQHLLDLGHTRIAFVGEPARNPMWFVTSVRREEGFRSALADAGVPENLRYLRYGPHMRSAARQLATELLALAVPPTAVVAASDTQAVGVVEAARESGRSIPQELSVVGYDDIELASLVGLTTIRQPLETSGVRAAEIMLGALEGGVKPQPFDEVLPLELVVRETTGVAPRRALSAARSR